MVSPTVDRRLGLVGNTAIKAPVTVLAATNITQSGQQTIDGVAVLAINASGVADRVLCTGMTDGTKNGIFDVSTGAWTRSLDADGTYDLVAGTTVLVTLGTTYAGSYWKISTTGSITIGTTSITWTRALTSAIDTLSFLQAGTGAVTRGAQDKERDIVHAADYGVVGNGVTDDTTTLANAITQATTLKKRLLISGTPLISSQITVPDGASIEFDGAPGNFAGQIPKSYLIKKNTGASYVAMLVSGQSALLKNGGVIAQAGNAGDNIQITGASVTWEHPYSSLAGNDNCRIGKDGSGAPNANKFLLISPCFVSAVRDNLNVHDNTAGAPNANGGTITSPFVSNAGRHNLYANNSFGNTVVGILSESAVGKGVYLDQSCVAWTFIGGDVEQNTSSAGVAGSDIVIITSIVGAGGQKGNNQFLGTNVGTPPTDNGWMTGRGWTGFPGFGPASGGGTINGEKTWTPTFAGTVTPGTNTYATQVGYIHKNGRRLTAFFDLQLSGGSSAMSGNLRVSGLPFSGLASAAGFAPSLISSVTFPSTNYCGISGAVNGTNIDLYAYGSGVAFSALTTTMISSSAGRIAGEFSFMTADS